MPFGPDAHLELTSKLGYADGLMTVGTNKMSAFDKAVCVVTGAAAGLGRAIAQELALQGATLELWDSDPDGLAETHAGLKSAPNCTTSAVNVGDWEAVTRTAAAVAQRHGQIDYVFNNAAIALSATVANAEISEYHRVLKTSLFGVIHGSKAFLPFFVDQGSGHIVNISSILASIATPTQSAYCCTKAAVSSFTHCMARELAGSGIKVSLVLPAGLRTNMAANAIVGQAAGAGKVAALGKIARKMRGDPCQAARRILRGVAGDRLRVFTGADARVLDLCARIFPVGPAWLWRRLLGLRPAAKGLIGRGRSLWGGGRSAHARAWRRVSGTTGRCRARKPMSRPPDRRARRASGPGRLHPRRPTSR